MPFLFVTHSREEEVYLFNKIEAKIALISVASAIVIRTSDCFNEAIFATASFDIDVTPLQKFMQRVGNSFFCSVFSSEFEGSLTLMVGISKRKPDRQWRRAQTEKKFNNTLRRLNSFGSFSMNYYLGNTYEIRYERRTSINEFEIIEAKTPEEFAEYQKLRAKK